MKLVKQYKGFKIKQITDREKNEWGWTADLTSRYLIEMVKKKLKQ